MSYSLSPLIIGNVPSNLNFILITTWFNTSGTYSQSITGCLYTQTGFGGTNFSKRFSFSLRALLLSHNTRAHLASFFYQLLALLETSTALFLSKSVDLISVVLYPILLRMAWINILFIIYIIFPQVLARYLARYSQNLGKSKATNSGWPALFRILTYEYIHHDFLQELLASSTPTYSTPLNFSFLK